MSDVKTAYKMAKHKVNVKMGKIRQRIDLGTKAAEEHGGVSWQHVGDLGYVATVLQDALDFLDGQNAPEAKD